MDSKNLKEALKKRKVWGGITLVVFGIAGLNGVDPWTAVSILAVLWGLMGIVWPYNFMANKQMLQEHHHHHHHNNKTPAKKIGKAKKNYKRT